MLKNIFDFRVYHDSTIDIRVDYSNIIYGSTYYDKVLLRKNDFAFSLVTNVEVRTTIVKRQTFLLSLKLQHI